MMKQNHPHDLHLSPSDLLYPLTVNQLSHIASCEFCAKQLVTYTEDTGLIKAPRDLQVSILSKINRPDIQTGIQLTQSSKRLQLFFYSLKISTGILISLLMLSFLPKAALLTRMESREPFQPFYDKEMPYYQKARALTDYLNQITLPNMEVFYDDKKEK